MGQQLQADKSASKGRTAGAWVSVGLKWACVNSRRRVRVLAQAASVSRLRFPCRGASTVRERTTHDQQVIPAICIYGEWVLVGSFTAAAAAGRQGKGSIHSPAGGCRCKHMQGKRAWVGVGGSQVGGSSCRRMRVRVQATVASALRLHFSCRRAAQSHPLHSNTEIPLDSW